MEMASLLGAKTVTPGEFSMGDSTPVCWIRAASEGKSWPARSASEGGQVEDLVDHVDEQVGDRDGPLGRDVAVVLNDIKFVRVGGVFAEDDRRRVARERVLPALEERSGDRVVRQHAHAVGRVRVVEDMVRLDYLDLFTHGEVLRAGKRISALVARRKDSLVSHGELAQEGLARARVADPGGENEQDGQIGLAPAGSARHLEGIERIGK